MISRVKSLKCTLRCVYASKTVMRAGRHEWAHQRDVVESQAAIVVWSALLVNRLLAPAAWTLSPRAYLQASSCLMAECDRDKAEWGNNPPTPPPSSSTLPCPHLKKDDIHAAGHEITCDNGDKGYPQMSTTPSRLIPRLAYSHDSHIVEVSAQKTGQNHC